MRSYQVSIAAFLISCVLLSTASVAEARSRARSRGLSGTYQGTVISVGAKSVNVDIGTDRPKTVSILVDDKTTVSGVDGKPGTTTGLAKGQKVSVKVTNNKAVSITVNG